MGLKRYTASADTTITNAFQPDLVTRGTGANMGLADVMDVFSIYGRATTSSVELSRILVQFPIDTINTDRTNNVLPGSGSVSWFLRLFNAKHSRTVPPNAQYVIYPVSQSWQEGIGLDLESYKDLTKGNSGANWMSASDTAKWSNVGGMYITASGQWEESSNPPTYTTTLDSGLEDIEVDISRLVEKWIAHEAAGSPAVPASGRLPNYGVGVHLTASQEGYFSASLAGKLVFPTSGSMVTNLSGATLSYYIKRFFARGSQFFFKRPVLEARWDSATRDDRGDFMYSSSLAPGGDNLNTLYFYNYVRGQLTDIPGVPAGETLLVSIYSGSTGPTGSKLLLSTPSDTYNATGGWAATGIYSCSICVTAAREPFTKLFDVWHKADEVTQYYTGSFNPYELEASVQATKPLYYLNITNMRPFYAPSETYRFNVYVRPKNWHPTIYTVASNDIEATIIHSASYRVYRILDGYPAVPYGTGSDKHTYLSYDVSGNYFDLDMSLLEAGYAYGIKLAFYDKAVSSWTEQREVFKFRVEDYEY